MDLALRDVSGTDLRIAPLVLGTMTFSERILGDVVGPFRSQVLIASKVFDPMGPGADDRGLRRPAIEKALDATLKRLGTDYLDLY